MVDKQNNKENDKQEIIGTGDVDHTSYEHEQTFEGRMKNFGILALNSHNLVGNFLTLFDKRYEKELPQNIKNDRDTAESVIFWSSLGGRILAINHVARGISFLNRLPFNPLRDIRVLFVALGTLFLCDSIPISYYFPKFEDTLIQRFESKQITNDLYADTNLNQFKIWYYTQFY